METFLKYLFSILFLVLASPNKVILTSNSATDVTCIKTSNCEICSCHQHCHLYNKCCSDKVHEKNVDHKYLDPSIYSSCGDVNKEKYYIFDRCPPKHNVTKHVTDCEHPKKDDWQHDIPAFGKTSKKLYRNLYCALCHGEDYIQWNPTIECTETVNVDPDNLMSIVNNSKCEKVNKLPSENLTTYRISCTSAVIKCPHHIVNKTSEDLCTLLNDTHGFEKAQCTLSNDDIYANITCCKQIVMNKINTDIYPLTIIFNYKMKYLLIKETIDGKQITKKLPFCPKYTEYDKNTMRCRVHFYHTLLNCTATRLKISEYHITSDGLLYLNNTQRLLNQSEFSLDSQGVSICVKNGTNVIAKYSIAERYITLVGLIISIPALAITIIVYLCIPELRTLPGKLLISLLSALFLSELLFLISPQVTTFTVLCTSLAVVMHYSFLATFFWMNVMSFDAWYTFSGLTQLRSIGKGNKRLVLYSLYAWICPLVIVTISLIFEYIPGNHGFSPEYGKGNCWITNGNSLLCFFAIPVIIILCLNIIAFILTARGLHLASKLSSKYLSKHNKKQFFIYMKLSFIMGLTWIFAFLYTFTSIEEFSLLFCILNSFIGLFICLSFLLTKLVYRSFLRTFLKIRKYVNSSYGDISTISDNISLNTQHEISLK